jgi:hypothetical protein
MPSPTTTPAAATLPATVPTAAVEEREDIIWIDIDRWPIEIGQRHAAIVSKIRVARWTLIVVDLRCGTLRNTRGHENTSRNAETEP